MDQTYFRLTEKMISFVKTNVMVIICLTHLVESQSIVAIGKYGDVIKGYKQCGLSKVGIHSKPECFEYSENMVPISQTRDAFFGEVPWMVAFTQIYDDTIVPNFTIGFQKE